MRVVFSNKELKQWFETPLNDIEEKLPFNIEILKQYKKKVQLILSADSLIELKKINGLNFEALKGDRKGQFSIRLNKQYRLIIKQLTENENSIVIDIVLIIEISKHYE